MNIQLSSDAPNRTPTIRDLRYVTLAEYCRLAGREHLAVVRRLERAGLRTYDHDGCRFLDEYDLVRCIGRKPGAGNVLPANVWIHIA
jgi:hypothetical protein